MTIEEITSLIVQYENGDMGTDEMVDFFATLVKSGYIMHLQGSYQRTVADLIDPAFIHTKGNVLKYPDPS